MPGADRLSLVFIEEMPAQKQHFLVSKISHLKFRKPPVIQDNTLQQTIESRNESIAIWLRSCISGRPLCHIYFGLLLLLLSLLFKSIKRDELLVKIIESGLFTAKILRT